MEARPPELMDRVVRVLIPPIAREAVAGDLWERYRSPLHYALEALRVLPFVILSQVRRTSNIPMLGIVAFTFFVCFGGFTINGPDIDVPRWLRAAIPTLAALAGLMARDVYKGLDPRPARRAAFDVLTVIGCLFMSQAVLAGLSAFAGSSPDWVLTLTPRRALLTTFALATVFCLRMWVDYRLPPADGDMSVGDLVREYQQFERSVRWRRRREVASVICALIVSSGFLMRATDFAAQMGWALSTALALFIAWYLARRTSVERIPRQTNFASSLALYRSELDRQTKVLRSVAWLWSSTIIPPIMVEVIGRGLGIAQPFVHPLHVGGYFLICFLVGWLYVKHARTLQQRSEHLATIAKRAKA